MPLYSLAMPTEVVKETQPISVKVPKILFLALEIAKFFKKQYYNTNDLTDLANKYQKVLVRTRADKKDYKYLEDTNFGGLRGNFSTLLTWKGFVKRGSLIVNTCSLGRDGRLVNAVCNGEIILNASDLTAHTNNARLKRLLEVEGWLFNVREGQAHIKAYLEKHPEIPLERDNVNFKKVSVVKSKKDQYFIRSIVNNFSERDVLEYNLLNLWEGIKLKKKNLHCLIVIPGEKNPWSEIRAVKIEDLLRHKPLLIEVNLKTQECKDKDGNVYKLYTLPVALETFSSGSENINERLAYDWEKLKRNAVVLETDAREAKEDEYSVFVNNYLNWKKGFEIDGKTVVDIKVSSSGGPDVTLVYSGGTTQKVELEHQWKNYLDHGHYKDNAWSGSWIFAEEEWDAEKIKKLFGPLKKEHNTRIPDVFLCLEQDERKAYLANWDTGTFTQLSTQF